MIISDLKNCNIVVKKGTQEFEGLLKHSEESGYLLRMPKSDMFIDPEQVSTVTFYKTPVINLKD